MTKTPEQMAEEYSSWVDTGSHAYRGGIYEGFLVGYEAAKPQWISIHDRLPEENIPVLAFVFDSIEVGYIEIPTTDNHEFHWIGDHNYIDKAHRAITHWMPLPKPPEAKE